MGESDQLEKQLPINAYLSYRCKNNRDIAARDKLKSLCDNNNINLIFDQNGTEEGDSLTEFMDDLSAARFVFLFLSPEYFQSAYTLYELISIHEQGDLDKRFIFPLRLTETMVTYEWTTAKNYFDNNEAVRKELARLLEKHNIKHDNLWHCIDEAWNTTIFPYLDRLNVSLENKDADDALSEFLGKTKTTADEAIKKSTSGLHEKLVGKISTILNRNNINANDKFWEELKLIPKNDISDIANQLVKKTKIGEAIAVLTRVLESQQLLLGANEWKACFYDAEQICGWLLLNSVDPIWWFHHEVKLDKTAKANISGNFELHDDKYIEVVICRGLHQNARYVLDKHNQPKPAGHKYDVMCFDGQAPKAKQDELLHWIYKDLYGVSPSSDDDILSKIIRRAKTHKINENKLIYYLVSSDYLAMWESLAKTNSDMKQLAGYLQFICCNKSQKSDKHPASTEDQSQLLDQVAYLLSLQQ